MPGHAKCQQNLCKLSHRGGENNKGGGIKRGRKEIIDRYNGFRRGYVVRVPGRNKADRGGRGEGGASNRDKGGKKAKKIPSGQRQKLRGQRKRGEGNSLRRGENILGKGQPARLAWP